MISLRDFLLSLSLAVLVLAGSAAQCLAFTPVELLDGKLTLEIADGFVPDKDRVAKQTIAAFKAKKGDAWGAVVRGTRGLDPAALGDYLTSKSAEYTRGLAWLPKLTWLKKDTITLRGRPWADLCFIGQMPDAKNPKEGMLYTRILATSYEGQLLEIIFTSNTDRSGATRTKIDRMIESVKLAD
jgi:hypothetical protein